MNTKLENQRREALRLCLAGRAEQALQILAEILKTAPDDSDSWLLLGRLHVQQRRFDLAQTALTAALQLQPAHPGALYMMGRVRRASGDTEAAEGYYRRALAVKPDDADVHTSLGVLLRSQGRHTEAIEAYRRALAIEPRHAEAALNLSNALAVQGASAEAQELRARGGAALTSELLRLCGEAEAFLVAHDFPAAQATINAALRIGTDSAPTHSLAARIAWAAGDPQACLQHLESAISLDSTDLAAVNSARRICVAGGLYERAMRYSEQMQLRAPSVAVGVAARLALPAIQQSRETIQTTRDRYAREVAAIIAEGREVPGTADRLAATDFDLSYHCAFYLAYHGQNDRGLMENLAQMHRSLLPDLSIVAPHCLAETRSAGRIRIGLISRFFFRHSIGKTTRGFIDQLSRERFEVYLIRITPSPEDELTDSMRAAADGTFDLSADLFVARQQIADLGLDILFYQDIGMESMSYFLACSRLAPVQCLSFGHPNTTGIPAMDYFISNDLFESGDAASHYTEQLVLLKGLPTLAYYYRPRLDTTPQREMFGFAASETVYLCPQQLFKLHPDFDPLVQGILGRDPAAVVVFIAGPFVDYTERLTTRMRSRMPDLMHRVRVLERMPFARFLELLAVSDVVLDTLHFNGMNTSLEALAFGTPVVTLPGEFQRGRHTYGMYRAMDFLECVAKDAADYVAIALRLGLDPDYRSTVRREILGRNQVLFENPRVVAEFERFFLAAVQGARGDSRAIRELIMPRRTLGTATTPEHRTP